MAFVDTPRTDLGNATFMSDGHNFRDLSMEKSFASPVKKRDAIPQKRSNRNGILKTPAMRNPLATRHNLPKNHTSNEFTPLLKSAVKRNTMRIGKENAAPQTPAFLKHDYRAEQSPALPIIDSSVLFAEGSSSLVGRENRTPLAQLPSSSLSTPLALPINRHGDGAAQDHGNLLTLREQENMVDKIEKENFGLKLKIHYLEESLQKSNPDYHETALKENTELKVDKVTLLRELAMAKKKLTRAEHELQHYAADLATAQENAEQKRAMQEMEENRESLRVEVETQAEEISRLRRRLESTGDQGAEVERLRNALEDLQADLTTKDREIEEHEDELENLSRDLAQAREKLAEADDEHDEKDELKETVQELESQLQKATFEAQEAREASDEAIRERQSAVDDLDELREEMSNKSFTTKGLSRQIEEKAAKLEDDLIDLRDQHARVNDQLRSRDSEVLQLENAIDNVKAEAEIQQRKLRESLDRLRKDQEAGSSNASALDSRIRVLTTELQVKVEEKDLLQNRHDALTSESRGLQNELNEAHRRIQDLENDLQEERRHALGNDRDLRQRMDKETSRLADERDAFRQRFEAESSKSIAARERWNAEQQELKMRLDQAEQKAGGLQRNIDRLQENEGVLSSHETKMHDALESERQRHHEEEALLSRQIGEVQSEMAEKQKLIEKGRSEMAESRNELRVCARALAAAEQRVQALEDEVMVLQGTLDEEAEANAVAASATHELEAAQRQLHSAKREVDLLQNKLAIAHEQKTALQDRLDEANVHLANVQFSSRKPDDDDDSLGVVRRDLDAARAKETDHLQQESSSRKEIRALKNKISRLERERHQFEVARLAVDSPQSSASSARKTEVAELRHQLVDARQEVKDARTKSKEVERSLQRSLTKAQESLELQTEELSQQVSSLRDQQETLLAQHSAAESTIARLRGRIATLEKDAHTARRRNPDDIAIVDERKDLHDMLKDAKLEAEDLHLQLKEQASRLSASALREQELRSQLRRVRDERSSHIQRASALSTELDQLQRRYERKVDEMARNQQAMLQRDVAPASHAPFASWSGSGSRPRDRGENVQVAGEALVERERQHASELRGMAKQIQCVQAKWRREQRFRQDLAWEKRFLLLQAEMFGACNSADLRLLEAMGVAPARETREKVPTLRAVGQAIVAALRLRRMAADWAAQVKVQASVVKKAEQVKRNSKRRIVK